MPDQDSLTKNILGAQGLTADINKTKESPDEEVGELTDAFELSMSDEELIDLASEWKQKHDKYYPTIKDRAKQNKIYYAGQEYQTGLQVQKGTSSNLIFEAQETFIPQALAKNPEPVVWSDNTNEGKEASNQIKAMLQFKADTMGLRKKLAIVLRHWSIYFIGILKHGWDEKSNDFTTEIRNPKDFVWDPDAYIDEIGRYHGEYIGERCTVTARKLIDQFPNKKDYITLKVDGKLGTKVTYTEWWTDDYCFYTFEDEVLDKSKNPYFNYETKEKNTEEEQAAYGLEPVTVTPGKNHFATPLLPYSFFSVFTLREQPHDVTNLIEQAIPQQDRILERDIQITKNLRNGNNSLAVSGVSFTAETARQAARAIEDGDPVLVPDGRVREGIARLPASPLPSGILEAQENDRRTLRGIFGTGGLTPQPQTKQTARGMILGENQDSSRIGGGIGESLEQLADNVFNWWLQLMYVFYDEPHYGSIMGQGKAVEYVTIINSNLIRQFVISVVANSMAPKDEISEQNLALDLAAKGWLDPINLYKRLNYPDPQETAEMVTLFKLNPQMYYDKYLGGAGQVQPGGPTPAGGGQGPDVVPPPDTGLAETSPAEGGLLNQVPIQTP